ncbi:hypothetical protein IV454_23340 [Massilia antarctica]|uniref:Uncharacterized protein n=1 Tax=Massilia antarctica TaxID=2765360 RepID=A0AA48WBI1_9BURK|nr:hypothetical protein [Massilia antarctica]QPI48444.1 hypothetical protein IV454_23340 [Massilia antarctica]
MKTHLAFLFSLIALNAVGHSHASATVDLDQSGAMARLQQDNPVCARSIQHILRTAPQLKPGNLATRLKTMVDADMVSTQLIKTSDPPQARLSFVLGNTRYKATVPLTHLVIHKSCARRRPF